MIAVAERMLAHWLFLCFSPDNKDVEEFNENDLDYAEHEFRSMIDDGRKMGYDFAADNLEYFLSGEGGVKEVDSEFLKRNTSVKNLVRSNKRMIDEASFEPVNELEVGETVNFTLSYEDSRNAFYGSDLSLGSGGYTIKTEAKFTVTRTAKLIYEFNIEIINTYHDDYNWDLDKAEIIPGHGYIPDTYGYALELNGRAKDFELHSEWSENDNFILYGLPILGYQW